MIGFAGTMGRIAPASRAVNRWNLPGLADKTWTFFRYTNKSMNILFITADQWRGDCISAVGHPCVKTPNFDRLINDAVLFGNHYSVTAPCAPARASLLTGMYQQNHRVVCNGTPLDERHTNLARELRAAGYRPLLFGYTDTSPDPRYHSESKVIEHGYENMMPGFEEGLLLTDGNPTPWLRHLRDNGYSVNSALEAHLGAGDGRGDSVAAPLYRDEHSQTAFLTDRVIRHIDSADADWCIHLSWLRPHPPFVATAPWNTMYPAERVPAPARAPAPRQYEQLHPWLKAALSQTCNWFGPWIQQDRGSALHDQEMRKIQAAYYGLVSKVDHYLGKLLDHLENTGQYDNTLIVLTADHGELLGDRWLFGKGGFFDSAYHIPLIVRDPSQPENVRGRTLSSFTESVDVMPTMLDALGLPIPRQCDGRSLMPHIRGEQTCDVRQEVHWEYDFRDVENAVPEKILGITMDECQISVIRDQRYKYVHFTRLPALFFDLQNDPAETNNLIDDPGHASDVMRLMQRMISWRMHNDERTLTHINVSREKIYRRNG